MDPAAIQGRPCEITNNQSTVLFHQNLLPTEILGEHAQEGNTVSSSLLSVTFLLLLRT